MTERLLLLVDDDKNVASSLVRLLRRDGYKILCADSGQEGLKLLESYTFGVIISDQRMPDMTGVEFLSQVKEIYPDTVRIVLSGYTELNSVVDAINKGAVYRFLTKPWDDQMVRAYVAEAFQLHELKSENIKLNRQVREANAALSCSNLDLEQRVAEKTREAVLNLDILRVAQEILEILPIAVIGTDSDGMVAYANQVAWQLFSDEGARPLFGELITQVIPAEIIDLIQPSDSSWKEVNPCFSNEINWIGRYVIMGTLSQSTGKVWVIDPVLYHRKFGL
jgi:response regulator RpfG family c-di-GMP phosphodiesterase